MYVLYPNLVNMIEQILLNYREFTGYLQGGPTFSRIQESRSMCKSLVIFRRASKCSQLKVEVVGGPASVSASSKANQR